ncbi:MAG: dienelactone hydrolase family protein [Hyphomonadaceae bacterium]|nr:dienelactone hydrolase family protein [Hyphomonadaceae bacterium]
MTRADVTIAVGERRVSGLIDAPKGARAVYVFGHGAGAGMRHAGMEAVAVGLAARGVAVLRYQFPYMEAGGKRPDPPALCHATVRAAVGEAAKLNLPMFAGGRSFGGRMTSQAEALAPLGVRGLAFVGFPLHPAGKPSDERAKHLDDVGVPMLFLSGTKDALAELSLLEPVVKRVKATLVPFPDADHSFHVPAKSGRKDAEVREQILDAMTAWFEEIAQ